MGLRRRCRTGERVMKVEVLQPVAGRRWAYPAGVHDVPDDIAKRLVDAGTAKKVRGGKSEDTGGSRKSYDKE